MLLICIAFMLLAGGIFLLSSGELLAYGGIMILISLIIALDKIFRKLMKSKNMPVAFITLMLGIFLLVIDWMPLIGWLLLIIAIINAIITMLANTEDKSKKKTIIMIILIIIVVLLITLFSITQIQYSFIKSYADLSALTGLAVGGI